MSPLLPALAELPVVLLFLVADLVAEEPLVALRVADEPLDALLPPELFKALREAEDLPELPLGDDLLPPFLATDFLVAVFLPALYRQPYVHRVCLVPYRFRPDRPADGVDRYR